MADKLSIIQDACGLTGNRIPAVADDGSDEWNIASIAFEAAIDTLIEAHNWNFATAVATLQRTGDSPDDQFEDAYPKPTGSLAVVWVRVDDVPVDYKIIDNKICLNDFDGVVTSKYVRTPDAGSWPPMFVDIMRTLVMAGLYRGMNEDTNTAIQLESQAYRKLGDARTRTDQEQPKRALFTSRMRQARTVRRPWPNSPRGWGGTGNPS